MLFFILQANIIRLEVPVEKLNGLEAEYREEYDDLYSVPAKAFVDEFVFTRGRRGQSGGTSLIFRLRLRCNPRHMTSGFHTHDFLFR